MTEGCCRVCGDPVDAKGLACALYHTPHHRDCWLYQGGCSIFGCGSERALPLASLPPDSTALLRLEPEGRPSGSPRLLAQGLGRRLRSRLEDLPETLRDSLFAVLLTALLFLLLEGIDGNLLRPLALITAVGVLHGALAPFLAPWQDRSPGRLAILALLTFLLLTPGRLLTLPLGRTTLQVLLATVFASGLSMVLLGDRTRPGEALGPFATPLRYLLTWVLATALWIAAVLLAAGSWSFSLRELLVLSLFGVLSAATAAPSLEAGARAYRKKLLGQ